MAGTKRQLQKKETRKQLIDTAIEQFAEHGLTRTRTADIARAAKVSHGTVFVHFSTQEELLVCAIDEFGSRINVRLHELASGKSVVRELLEAHLESLMEFEGFYTGLVTESRLLPKAARNTFIMIQSTISFHICQALERETEAGTIPPQPVHMVFNGWIGLVHHYLINSDLFSPGGSVLKRYGGELIQYYMSLISRNEGVK